MAAATAVGAVALSAYALYFDHQRRSNPEFRKELKRRVKKLLRNKPRDRSWRKLLST